MGIGATLLNILILMQVSIQGDLRTRAHVRYGGKDSTAFTWFSTRASLSFVPVTSERLETKLGMTVKTNGYPFLTNASDLSDASKLEPVSFMLDEVFVRVYDILPGLNLTAGRQKVHWGTADAVNPTDNFTTPDYSDPLVWDERRPVWMVYLGYMPVGDFGIELGAKPIFEPAVATAPEWFSVAVLPDIEQLRNGLIQEFIRQGLDSLTARQIAAAYTITVNEDIKLPSKNVRDITWGGRLKGHLGNFDFALSFLRGYDFLPAVQPVTNIDVMEQRLDFVLKQWFPEKKVVGAELAGNLFGVGFWAEAAYAFYEDTLVKDEPSVICGFDYAVAGFYFNLQYLHGDFPLARLQKERVKDFILGAVERKLFTDRVLTRLGGVVDLKKGSFGLVPLIRFQPVGGFEIDLGGMVFSGGNGSAFAPLNEVDELFFGVRYRF